MAPHCTALNLSDNKRCQDAAASLNGLFCAYHSRQCQGKISLSAIKLLLPTKKQVSTEITRIAMLDSMPWKKLPQLISLQPELRL